MLGQSRKTRPDMTEKLLTVMLRIKTINQTNNQAFENSTIFSKGELKYMVTFVMIYLTIKELSVVSDTKVSEKKIGQRKSLEPRHEKSRLLCVQPNHRVQSIEF